MENEKKDTKIIFVGNYKGGVGKTTSVLNFADYFSRVGKKVLVLDIDPQSSLSEILVSNCGNGVGSLADLPMEETLNYIFDLYISKIEKYPCVELQIGHSVIKSYKNKYDFVPSSLFYGNGMGLDALAIRMKKDIQYLSILKNWVDTVKEQYDFILIDCPPSNNLITQSAFLMSDYYIIPTILDGLSTNGVRHYIDTVEKIYEEYCEGEDIEHVMARHFFGEQPELMGVFYTLIRSGVDYSVPKLNFEAEMVKIKQNIILNGKIGNYIDIARCTSNGNISIEREDYNNLTEELLKRIAERG